MTLLDDITPIVITWNEAPNVNRVFDQLKWARKVVVVDSGSTDETLSLLHSYSNVVTFENPFVSHADQANFALRETGISTEWVLSIDADYVLPDPLIEELAALSPPADIVGYSVSFRYVVLAQPLRGSLYPPRVVLFRRLRGTYEQEGHAHRLRVDGPTLPLRARALHDDRKLLSRWVLDQERYTQIEADRLLSAPFRDLDWPDRIRRTGILGPPFVALYCLIAKGLVLDGVPGWYYTLQRVVAEALLAMKLWRVDR